MSEAAESFFVDTNIALYSLDASEPAKQKPAQRWMELLWEFSVGKISWQVVHEFYSNAVRKLGVPIPVARLAVEQLVKWSPHQPSLSTMQRAWHWCDVSQINFWDALIVAAAEHSGCHYLLSEDFQAGRRFGSVTVVNPFEQPPSAFASLRTH